MGAGGGYGSRAPPVQALTSARARIGRERHGLRTLGAARRRQLPQGLSSAPAMGVDSSRGGPRQLQPWLSPAPRRATHSSAGSTREPPGSRATARRMGVPRPCKGPRYPAGELPTALATAPGCSPELTRPLPAERDRPPTRAVHLSADGIHPPSQAGATAPRLGVRSPLDHEERNPCRCRYRRDRRLHGADRCVTGPGK